MFLYAYKKGSESAKAIKDALRIRQIRNVGSVFKGKHTKDILNWGATEVSEEVAKCNIINLPSAVKRAVNKLETFKTLQGKVALPEWTEDRATALEWANKVILVVARTVLEGHSGNGIILSTNPVEIPEAKLYTKYVPKTEEYRVHVFKDEAFFVQRKARKNAVPPEQVNWKIRNHAGGFIFAHQDVELPEEAKKTAIVAVNELGLDFGAVDIIWNKKRDMYYVLEVNTAPGLEGTTLEKYTEQFIKLKR